MSGRIERTFSLGGVNRYLLRHICEIVNTGYACRIFGCVGHIPRQNLEQTLIYFSKIYDFVNRQKKCYHHPLSISIRFVSLIPAVWPLQPGRMRPALQPDRRCATDINSQVSTSRDLAINANPALVL